MTQDYKPAPAGRSKPMNQMFLGILIGMLLGIGIALGVALWLNKTAIPFMEKSRPIETVPKLEIRTPPKAEPAAPPVEAPKQDKSRFEFYQILPGEKDAAGKDGKTAPRKSPELQAPAKAAAEKAPDRQPEKAAASVKETYFLQAGAFQSESDADNLKAKIAFIGLQATVKSVTLPDKGVLFRVRLGPYHSPEEVNRIKSALSDNGVVAAIVKTTDTMN
jgi:cell division protein FtsN